VWFDLAAAGTRGPHGLAGLDRGAAAGESAAGVWAPVGGVVVSAEVARFWSDRRKSGGAGTAVCLVRAHARARFPAAGGSREISVALGGVTDQT
jgi:hypothetical protein